MSYDYIGVVEDVENILKSRIQEIKKALAGKVQTNFEDWKRGYDERAKEEVAFLTETLQTLKEFEDEANEDARFDEVSDDDYDEEDED